MSPASPGPARRSTGPGQGGGRYAVNRYYVRDKHGTARAIYNAKMNIHRDHGDPIHLGIRNQDLQRFTPARVEALSRDGADSESRLVRRRPEARI